MSARPIIETQKSRRLLANLAHEDELSDIGLKVTRTCETGAYADEFVSARTV